MNEDELTQGNTPQDTIPSGPPLTEEKKEEDGPKTLAAGGILQEAGGGKKYYNLVCFAEFENEKKPVEQDFSGASHEAMEKEREQAIAEGRVNENGTPMIDGRRVVANLHEQILNFSSYTLQKFLMQTLATFTRTPAATSSKGNDYFDQAIQYVREKLQAEFNGIGTPKLLSAKFAVVDPDKGRAIYGDEEVFNKLNQVFDLNLPEDKEEPKTGVAAATDKIKDFANDVSSGKNKTANKAITVGLFIIIAIIVVIALLNK